MTIPMSISSPDATRSHAHEGLRAGALGATVVWLWFFVSGVLSGSPLRLATMFGRGILSLGGGTAATPAWEAVIAFAIAHFAFWCGLAALTLVFIHGAAHTPSLLSLGSLLFILFQLAFVGITAMLAETGLGVFAWPSVLLGNVAGWVATWWYIARRHPEIRTEMAHANDDIGPDGYA